MLTHSRNALEASKNFRLYDDTLAKDGKVIAQFPIGGAVKRIADLLISVPAIVLLLPTFAIVAFLIRLTSSGPIFFSHTRIGFQGKPFQCYKFRTMVNDADATLSRLLSRDPEAELEWSRSQKLKTDPRVTGIGRLLRKSSLDELPQLINVALGQMSLVGPRPVTKVELARYGRSASKYLAARPGLTGLWQISGRNSVSYSRRVALDRYYVTNWSFLMDITIILRTIPALIRTSHTS